MSKFVIVKDYISKVKRFNLKARKVEFKIKPTPVHENPVEWIKNAINDIIYYTTSDLEPTDKIGITFCCDTFKQNSPGWIGFRDASTVTVNDIWNVLASIFQSNSSGLNTDTFCLNVTSVRLPAGRGNERRHKYNSFNEECSKRKGIIVIDNKDDLCLPRALVVSMANACRDPDYRKVRRNIGKIQTVRANKLLNSANIFIPVNGAGIPELQKFQKYLKDYKITVYQYGGKGRDVIFEGLNEQAQYKINLLYHEGHYNVINSLTAAFACGYFCENCHAPYHHKNEHRCQGTCSCCQQSPVCQQSKNILCQKCNRYFRGTACFENHKKQGSLGKSSVCKEITRCTNCLKTVKSDRIHTCGEIFCKRCKIHTSSDHLCYMLPDLKVPKTKDTLFVFFDLETRQDRIYADGVTKIHEPNLCVLAKRCDKCIQEDALYFCQKCGYRLIVYKDNVIMNFMLCLLEARKKFKQIVVLAHNSQSFDCQFILHYILTETNLKPDLIMRGSKILLMELANIRFIDSLNYFPMALSKLPASFDLPPVLKKGYFPHLFNTSENENYIGILPAKEYYNPDTMNKEERIAFLDWYETHKNDKFDMQRELVEYCTSDVEILTRACLKFRDMFLKESNVCPFTEACTIASACNKVFRRNFLKPCTIGIIPKNGYRHADNQSKIAVQWLIWEELKRNINIQHAANGKEVILHGVKVDGFCSETKQVFQFAGCFYHGCTCLSTGRDLPLYTNSHETLNSLYESTIMTNERLRGFGYDVIDKWECEFKRECQENPDIRNAIENHPLLKSTPLNPRDAFYGGRTGNITKYYKCQPGEKIKYIDVCSLYPFICKRGKFPLGHPHVYVGDNCQTLNMAEIEGLIKCKILPPQDLYHPVLPYKMNGKLMFVLCKTCGENMTQSECNHTDKERALHGTWVIDEIRKALEKGYKILETYEVWSYKVDQFNPTTKEGGLFTEMMNKYIKIKQQASGWPSNCSSSEERTKYINEFHEKERVLMDSKDIAKNAGLRSMAKLMLNSFWGKLGQRENQPKTSIINQPEELYEMLSNPSLTVNHIFPVNDITLIVNWQFNENSYEELSTVNVCIAAYVTAQARLKLYSYLEQLGKRVLYYDTDSVIFISRENENDPPTGDFIGDMTDELATHGSGSYITEFVSGGPKNYSYKVHVPKDNSEKIICKVKGISLNYATSQLINFDSIRSMVLDETADSIIVTSANIRTTNDHIVVTKNESKIYRPNSLKRAFVNGFNSVPYGYKKKRTLEERS